MYLAAADCTGKTHEGKSCFWDAQSGECEEGAAGDLEHVCGQFATSDTCTIESGCVYDMKESKCEEISSLMLTSTHCSNLKASTCARSHNCFYESNSCQNRFLRTHQSESTSDKT